VPKSETLLQRMKRLLRRLRSFLPGTPPEHPTADVYAPLRPRKPHLSGAIALEEPDDDR
jgi:hypothetical protein